MIDETILAALDKGGSSGLPAWKVADALGLNRAELNAKFEEAFAHTELIITNGSPPYRYRRATKEDKQ